MSTPSWPPWLVAVHSRSPSPQPSSSASSPFLGVGRAAIRDRYGLDDLPDKETSYAIASEWRPYASVASWCCWRTLDLARSTETVAKG
jgi:hypothetical protein